MSESPRVAIRRWHHRVAASFLSHAGTGVGPRLTLVEAHQLGWKIRTDRLAGMPVKAGPAGFLARTP